VNDRDRLLVDVSGRLAAVGIAHMLCGSVASSLFGLPRSTVDIDLVISATPEQLDRFLATFSADDVYVSREAAHDALARRSMFNIIDLNSGYKVDLIFLKAEPYDAEAFRRRRPVPIAASAVDTLTPEDAILSKLAWSRESGSERQLNDALMVAAAQWPTLDLAYLRRWAHELNVSARLDELLNEAERIGGGGGQS
jgi:hypothetical protein